MKEVRVASRYAKSLLGLAVEQNKLDKIYQDMLFVKNTIADSRELELLLKNPIIKKGQKRKNLKRDFRFAHRYRSDDVYQYHYSKKQRTDFV